MSELLTHRELAGPTDEPLLEDTIGNMFDRTVEQFPDQEVVVSRHQGIRWTCRQYQQEVELLAGITHGSVNQTEHR